MPEIKSCYTSTENSLLSRIKNVFWNIHYKNNCATFLTCSEKLISSPLKRQQGRRNKIIFSMPQPHVANMRIKVQLFSEPFCYLPELYCGIISIYKIRFQLNNHFNMCSQGFILASDRTRYQMLPWRSSNFPQRDITMQVNCIVITFHVHPLHSSA